MNRKLEITIGILIVLVFTLVIGKNVFALSTDESKGIDKLNKAIENLDIKYLEKHIEIEDYSSPLSTEDIERIALLLKDEYINLNNYYNQRDSNIYVKVDGKEKLIFDKYVLVLKPYRLVLDADIEGAEVYLDGTKIGKIDDDHYFEYKSTLPGKHKIELKYKGEYVDLETQEDILIYDNYTSEIFHSMYLNGEYIWIDCNYYDAKLFVNDKDTGKTIRDIEYFGPIPLDGSIVLQAKLETDYGVLESEKVTIDDDYGSVYLELIEEEEVELVEDIYDDYFLPVTDLLPEFIMDYENNMVSAINNNDFDFVKPCLLEGSPLYESQKGLVKNLNEKGITEELLYYEILDVGEIVNNSLEVKVYEKHNVISPDGSEKVTEYVWIYTVVFENNNLWLSNIRE